MAKTKQTGYSNDRVGSSGLNLKDPNHVLGPYALRTLTNMFPTRGGSESRYGYTLWNEDTSKTGGIPFLHYFKSADGTKKQIIFSNDNDYYYLDTTDDSDSSWNTIGSMGSASDNPTAETYNDLVIFGSGKAGNTPKKWDGSVFTDITAPASVTNDLGFYGPFQGQDFAALFGAGDTSKPSRLYWSGASDPDDWQAGAASYLDIAIDDGSVITGIQAQGKQLIIYKNRKRYFISTYYESDSGVYGVRVNPYVDNAGGTEASESIQVMPTGDILALAHQGVGVQGMGKNESADGSLIPREYSYPILPLVDQIEYEYAYKARGVFFDRKYWIALPFGKKQTTNNYVFVLDVDAEKPAWTVIPDMNVGAWIIAPDEDGEDTLYFSDSNLPRIYKMNKNVFTDNGSAILSVARTGKLNLGTISDVSDKLMVAVEGYKSEGDELRLTINTDGTENKFIINDTFLVTNGGSGGYVGSDYIAEAYIGSGYSDTTKPRYLAIVLLPIDQRLHRKMEVQLENKNTGANWGWSHLTINELTANKLRMLPEKYIITELE